MDRNSDGFCDTSYNINTNMSAVDALPLTRPNGTTPTLPTSETTNTNDTTNLFGIDPPFNFPSVDASLYHRVP
jgi:hypothetical protein